MQTILLLGFEPYDHYATNPAQIVAERLNNERIDDYRIVGLSVPVEFGEDTSLAFAAIADHDPKLVISLGLSDGATCLLVERIAVNLKKTPDSEKQESIIADGFAALFSTLDAEHIADKITQAGVPAHANSYAGSYLCNHLFYQTLHYAQQWDLQYRCGFIHLPLSSEQVIEEKMQNQPSLPMDTIVRGVKIALEAAIHGA